MGCFWVNYFICRVLRIFSYPYMVTILPYWGKFVLILVDFSLFYL